MKNLLLIFALSSSILGFSQSKKTPDVFEEAYLVTLKGDTLKGHLKMPKLSRCEIYQKISFRDKTNKLKMYMPEKIKGYGMGNYFYLSAYFNNKPCFFKVLSSGKANLYQFCFELMEEGQKQEIQDFCVMTEGKEEFIVLEEKGLKKQLKDIFKSNKALVQKIGNEKEIPYNAEALEKYFKEYNETNPTN